MDRKPRKQQLHKRVSWRLVWQIIEQVACGHMTQAKAGESLNVSHSRIHALKERWLKIRGQEPHAGWLYDRPQSGRDVLPEAARAYLEEELRYYRQESPFFKGHINFAFLSQQCHQRTGKRIHRNSLRRWAIREGFYDPKTDNKGKPYVRFEKGGIGMLFQHDASIHVWLPYTRRQDTLIMSEDDHSRKVVGALLVPQETAWHHLSVVRKTLETYGCPLAYYVDNHLIFHHPQDIETQFVRALKSVGVEVRFTAKKYPEAKGKIEKRFDYFQRRIPLLCERYRTKNLTEANQILSDEVAYYNTEHIHAEIEETPQKRWDRALLEKRNYLHDLPTHGKLDILFAMHYPRYVHKDGAILFRGRRWPAPNARLRGHVTLVVRPPTGSRRPHTELYILDPAGREIAHHIVTQEQGSPPF